MRRLQQFSRTTLAIAALILLSLLSGCKKKKVVIPQPQEQAPTISQPPPPEQPAPQPQPPAEQPKVEEKPATAPKAKPTPKKKRAKKAVPAKPAEPARPTEASKSKTVVEEGGSNPPDQLSAKLPQNQTVQQRKSTAQLQQETENNLRSITRTLTADEQAMVQHIRSYVQQSRAAESDGDTERAYNLAMKARLLSDELVKR